jgi:hypothetical protein
MSQKQKKNIIENFAKQRTLQVGEEVDLPTERREKVVNNGTILSECGFSC